MPSSLIRAIGTAATIALPRAAAQSGLHLSDRERALGALRRRLRGAGEDRRARRAGADPEARRHGARSDAVRHARHARASVPRRPAGARRRQRRAGRSPSRTDRAARRAPARLRRAPRAPGRCKSARRGDVHARDLGRQPRPRRRGDPRRPAAAAPAPAAGPVRRTSTGR